MTTNWWCADCRMPVALDTHLRCSQCGSDAVDTLEPMQKRDARAAFAKHLYAQLEKIGA